MLRAYHLLSPDHALSNIALKRIKVAMVGDLNDPFELLSVTSAIPANREAFLQHKRAFARDNGLLCFGKSWNSPVLWSHYGAKHRGMALGFDIADDCQLPVDYIEKKIVFDGSVAPDEAFVRNLFRTKFVHWRYEDEIRMFVRVDHNTVEHGLYFYDFSERLRLREVIIGPLCEIPIEAVCSMVGALYEDVEILKAALSDLAFEVIAGSDRRRVGRAVASPAVRVGQVAS
jgi:hypothetical protein